MRNPEETTIRRAGTGIARAPDGIASGPFWVERLLDGSRDGEITAMRATLDPGVRTHWHSHPLGQLLYVLSGVGLARRDGGPVAEVRAGDSVFAYVSMQAVRDGTAVHWLEPV